MNNRSEIPFVPGSPAVGVEFRGQVRTLHEGLSVLAGEIAYVLDNCSNPNISSHDRAGIEKVFQAFQATVRYDVRDEIFNLEDKLGLRQGLPSNDPAIVDMDPRVTVEFIRDWLGHDFSELARLVKILEGGLASILVTETATNMLDIHARMLDALERVEALLAEAGR